MLIALNNRNIFNTFSNYFKKYFLKVIKIALCVLLTTLFEIKVNDSHALNSVIDYAGNGFN